MVYNSGLSIVNWIDSHFLYCAPYIGVEITFSLHDLFQCITKGPDLFSFLAPMQPRGKGKIFSPYLEEATLMYSCSIGIDTSALERLSPRIIDFRLGDHCQECSLASCGRR